MTKNNDAPQRTHRLHVRVSTELMKQLEAEANERGISNRQIVESCLAERYDSPRQPSRDAVIARRLNRIDNRLKVIERQEEVIAEYIFMFIKMWLAVTEELPPEKRKASLTKATARFDALTQSISEKLSSGKGVFGGIPKERVAG